MAIIQNASLFSWEFFRDSEKTIGDLERLKLVIESIPDQKLLDTLQKNRKNGRNDYPIDATWNSILAGIVFQHSSITSLRRELQRNAQLREMCGFDPVLGVDAVPTDNAYSRFLSTLIKHEFLIRDMFDSLVSQLTSLIPEFGNNLAGDGKIIRSYGKPTKKTNGDRRHDEDADWVKKTYRGIDKNGNSWKKVESFFGYRLHLIADADVELPIAYEVTKASIGEREVMKDLFKNLDEKHPEITNKCQHVMLDRGYDSKEMICNLWEKYSIKAVVDIRNMWKDSDPTRQLESSKIKNVTYNYKGTVFCHCPSTGEIRELCYGGFEKKRETLKYICPAKAYGINCEGSSKCPMFEKALRIPLKENPRIFTPVARSSYKWQKLYDKRTSIERVNSRFETSYGFEKHNIRGIEKMKVRCGLSLCVMLSIAVGRIREGNLELIKSLVKTAA